MTKFNRNFLGMKITNEANTSIHTIDNWGFAIKNTDYIGEPEQETTYINVPARNGAVDLSTALTGYPVYKKRKLKFEMVGFRAVKKWDEVISEIRNSFNGQKCKITLDNDISYYWEGRIEVNDFKRKGEYGTFTIEVPQADPYKYDVRSSTESSWKWDTFKFSTDKIENSGEVTVNGTATYTANKGLMEVAPTFKVNSITSAKITVTDGTHSIEMSNVGSYKDPRIKVNGNTQKTLTFTGNGRVSVSYRGGSL